jgi:hypothetical protein
MSSMKAIMNSYASKSGRTGKVAENLLILHVLRERRMSTLTEPLPVLCDVLLKPFSWDAQRHGSIEDSENNRKLSTFLHPFNIECAQDFLLEEWTGQGGKLSRGCIRPSSAKWSCMKSGNFCGTQSRVQTRAL